MCLKYSCGLLPGSWGSATPLVSDGPRPVPCYMLALPINWPTASLQPIHLFCSKYCLSAALCLKSWTAFGIKTTVLVRVGNKWYVGGRSACNLPVWQENGFLWVGACSIASPAGWGLPLVLGGRGLGEGDGGRGWDSSNQGDRYEVLCLCLNAHRSGGLILKDFVPYQSLSERMTVNLIFSSFSQWVNIEK